MSYENVLLIGGAKDGERISVLKGIPSIRVLVRADTDAYIGGPGVPKDPVFAEYIDYRRVPMHSSQGLNSCVYVIDGIDPLAALIEGYRKP